MPSRTFLHQQEGLLEPRGWWGSSDSRSKILRGLRTILFLLYPFLGFQIVAQKKMTRPLLLRFGRNAGKSTITVRPRAEIFPAHKA